MMPKHDTRTDGDARHVSWTADKLAYMAEIIPGHTEPEIRSLFAERYGITLTAAQIGNTKTRLGIKSGTHGGRFVKGHVPYCKGKTWDEYLSKDAQERIRATCFKPGNLPHTARDVGEERLGKDGYVRVHVAQRRNAKANDQWRLKHHLVWERANGCPVPDDTVILFADRDRGNFDPDNLVAVPRALLATINHAGIKYHDRETLLLAIDIAKLTQQISKTEHRPRHCKKCGCEFSPRFKRQRTCDVCLGRGVSA